ncbi:MAG TPA: hypothetical protein PLQ64_07630 [Thiobacillaceae bacterium]|nr:hypothetical protein [Thiobacillaceae bacterium]HNH88465.1 hypothetical protein [Thiobacillaceae bacterium]HNI09232.1 hypothetical protein [Thiobacillaceae bacterium]
MSMKWEVELRYPGEDDEDEDVFVPDEDDFLDCVTCPEEACFGDWLSPA